MGAGIARAVYWVVWSVCKPGIMLPLSTPTIIFCFLKVALRQSGPGVTLCAPGHFLDNGCVSRPRLLKMTVLVVSLSLFRYNSCVPSSRWYVANWFSKNYKASNWILSPIATLWTLTGTCTKHPPAICSLFQDILKKVMKHLMLCMCYEFRKNFFVCYWFGK